MGTGFRTATSGGVAAPPYTNGPYTFSEVITFEDDVTINGDLSILGDLALGESDVEIERCGHVRSCRSAVQLPRTAARLVEREDDRFRRHGRSALSRYRCSWRPAGHRRAKAATPAESHDPLPLPVLRAPTNRL